MYCILPVRQRKGAITTTHIFFSPTSTHPSLILLEMILHSFNYELEKKKGYSILSESESGEWPLKVVASGFQFN
jgi:hypothetical protein